MFDNFILNFTKRKQYFRKTLLHTSIKFYAINLSPDSINIYCSGDMKFHRCHIHPTLWCLCGLNRFWLQKWPIRAGLYCLTHSKVLIWDSIMPSMNADLLKEGCSLL